MKFAPRVALPALIYLGVAWANANAGMLTVQVTDAAGKPLVDVVVVADPVSADAMPKAGKAADIEQRGLKFLPLVSVIQTGSRVSFPNNDKVRHHIYSFSPAKKFDQKLYSGVAAAPQVFDKPGTVVLGCNIHDRMVAYVKIVDSPFFAKTDAAGVARIELPTPGKYKVSAWHYNMAAPAAEQAVALKVEATAPLSFKLAIKPPAAESEAGGMGGY
ncbi:MAG: methylamine utilization protein [Bdellovibrionales bacterium]|nr:methylamine utilization protein [Massilia sp.]